jgi:hypothetical protein
MKYLKKFEESEKSLKELCKNLKLNDYNINEYNTVDVNEDVVIKRSTLKKLPLQFNIVNGNFNCSDSILSTLEGAPKKVSGSFDCSDNMLSSLENGPVKVGDSYYCSDNILENLLGCPEKINGSFHCKSNYLTSLKNGPKIVDVYYTCWNNNLISLEGLPEKLPRIDYMLNPICEIIKIFGSLNEYLISLDYNYLRGTDIVSGRFIKACENADVIVPDSIRGYNYI